jgi:hypothetical protein
MKASASIQGGPLSAMDRGFQWDHYSSTSLIFK